MIFKDIPGFPGYQISYCGKVFSQKSNKILTTRLNASGYPTVSVRISGRHYGLSQLVHRLVALTWIPNPENLPIVLHKDDNKLNSHRDNLMWGTSQINNTWNGIHQGIRGAKYRSAETYAHIPAQRLEFKKTCKVHGWDFDSFTEILSHRKQYERSKIVYYFYVRK